MTSSHDNTMYIKKYTYFFKRCITDAKYNLAFVFNVIGVLKQELSCEKLEGIEIYFRLETIVIIRR